MASSETFGRRREAVGSRRLSVLDAFNKIAGVLEEREVIWVGMDAKRLEDMVNGVGVVGPLAGGEGGRGFAAQVGGESCHVAVSFDEER